MARRSAPSDVRRVNEPYTPQSGGVYLQFAHDRSWRVCVTVPARTKSSTCSWGVQCDGAIWTPSSNLYQNGWPGYAYGGRNTVTITTSYYPRIGGLSLFLTYYQNGSTSTPPHENPLAAARVQEPPHSHSYSVRTEVRSIAILPDKE